MWIIYCLLLSLVSGTVCAQAPALLRHPVLEAELPSSEVYAVYQDRRGYLWFGTDRGVARFNGESVQVLTTKQGLTSNVVFDFYEDDYGHIWFMTFYGGLCYWDGQAVKRPILEAKQEAFLASKSLYRLSLDTASQTLCMGFVLGQPKDLNQELKPYCVSLKTGQAQQIPLQNLGYGIYRISGRKELLAHRGKFIKARSLSRLEDAEAYIKEHGLTFHYASRFDSTLIWASQHDYLFEIRSGQVKAYYPQTISILHLSENHQGQLYLAGEGGSYYLAYPEQRLASAYNLTQSYWDQAGNLWLSTLGDGVLFASNLGLSQKLSRNGDKHNPIARLLVDRDKLYFADFYGGIGCITHQNNQAVSWLVKPYSKGPRNMGLFQQGARLISGLGLEIDLLSGKIDSAPHYNGIKSWIEHQGNYWGTRHNGLVKLDLNQREALNIPLFNQRSEILRTTAKGLIWVGTVAGLYAYNPKQNKVEPVSPEVPGLRQRITDIQYQGQVVFVATHGSGLMRRQVNGVWQQYDGEQGLLSEVVNRILIQEPDGVWIGTDKGLQYLKWPKESPHPIFSRVLNHTWGLSGRQVFDLSLWQQQLVVATSSGLSFLDSDKMHSPSPACSVEIAKILDKNGQSYQLEAFRYLPSWANELSLILDAACYQESPRIYRHKLLGYDDRWQFSAKPEIKYTNLEPGSYSLSLALGQDSLNTSQETRLQFEVLPRFYQTWWFYLCCFLLLTGLSGGLVFWGQEWRYQQQNLQRRLLKIELQALRAQMNPHFLFNSLNAINYFILRQEHLLALDYLQKFAQLLRAVIESSKKNLVPMEEELQSLKLYIELEALRLGESFQWQIHRPALTHGLDWCIPPMLLQPIVENALVHGLANQTGSKRLDIFIEQPQAERLSLRVRDSGIGREAAAQLRAQSTLPRQKSTGNTNISERLQVLSQMYRQAFSWAITDLKDEQGCPLGTEVTIHLPKLSHLD